MRQARLKPDYQDTWHHCYNRTVGTRADRPFGDAEKEMFVRMLKRLAAFSRSGLSLTRKNFLNSLAHKH